MKKTFFAAVISTLLLSSGDLSAFKYAGMGFGPGFGLKGFDGTDYFLNAEWKPHEYIGTRFMFGFPDGVWFGVGLNFTYTTSNKFSRTFKWSFNGGVPFVVNIHETYQTAFIGFNVGTTFSFDVDGRDKYFIYITPAEFFFFPITWRFAPNGGFDLDSNLSLITSVGFRVSI